MTKNWIDRITHPPRFSDTRPMMTEMSKLEISQSMQLSLAENTRLNECLILEFAMISLLIMDLHPKRRFFVSLTVLKYFYVPGVSPVNSTFDMIL